MAEKGRGGGHHPTGKALRYLFAKGILSGKGSGKERHVSYNKKRAGQVAGMRKRGIDTTSRKGFSRHNHNSNAVKGSPGGRHVFGGSKAAGLRGGGGGGGSKPKADHSATRAARIAAGREKAVAVLSGGNGIWKPSTVRNVLGDKGQNPAMMRRARTANKQLGVKAGVERIGKGLKVTPQAVAQKLMDEPKGARRERYFKIRQEGFDSSRAERVKNALGGAGKNLYAPTFTGGKLGKAGSVKDIQRRAYAALKRKEEAAKRKYNASDPAAFKKYFR